MSARTSAFDARPPILDVSQLLDGTIGESLAQGRGLRPTELIRRLLYRALWPYLEENRRVETGVIDALTKLHRAVGDLERRLYVLEASDDAEVEREEL